VTRWIPGHGGVPIAVTDAGPDAAPGAPPVLFVHGFAHARSVWAGVAGRLAPRIRAIRMDLRGHGESGWSTAGDYAVEHHAADVGAVLDALGLERAAIVAHSLGGHAATLATAARPERVCALVLVDTGPSLSVAAMMQVAAGVAEMLRSHPDVAAYREQLDLTYPLADPARLDALAAATLVRRRDGRWVPRLDPALLFAPAGPDTPAPATAATPGAGSTSLSASDVRAIADTEARLWDALAAVSCPALVVRGATSAMLPAEVARRMVDDVLPDARLCTLERAGHSVMLDAEAELAARVGGFLGDALDWSVGPQCRAEADAADTAGTSPDPRARGYAAASGAADQVWSRGNGGGSRSTAASTAASSASRPRTSDAGASPVARSTYTR